MVHWLYIDMNSFFASCEQHANPALRGKPVAVVPSMVETTAVLAASYEAKRLGIKTGTLVREARQLCPDIKFVETRGSFYVKIHHEIQRAVESCAPIEKICSIDEYAIRLTGSQRREEVAQKLAVSIKTAIRERVGPALTCSIGISLNRLLAKVAADMQKPDGLTLLSPGDLPHKLYSLKLIDIPGVGSRMEKHLMSQGVYNIETLLSKNEKEMRALWGGVWGSRMYYWLQGKDFDLTQNETASIGHQHVLEPKLRNYHGALLICKQLLDKAARRLRKSGYYARRLSLSIKTLGTEGYIENDIRFDETRDTITLNRALENIWSAVPARVRPLRVSVTLSGFTTSSAHQLSFFEDVKLDKVSEVMDEINERFGKHSVHLGTMHTVARVANASFIAFQHVPEEERAPTGKKKILKI